MEKICCFYTSNIHLITMTLPFIKKQIKNDVRINTFFEEDFYQDIRSIINNLIINETSKERILNINWKKTQLEKYINIADNLHKLIDVEKESVIFVAGSKKYINSINIVLYKYIKGNNYKNIKIINCYNVSEFDDNIKEILDEHELILNTAGIYKIEEIFENYKKAN